MESPSNFVNHPHAESRTPDLKRIRLDGTEVYALRVLLFWLCVIYLYSVHPVLIC